MSASEGVNRGAVQDFVLKLLVRFSTAQKLAISGAVFLLPVAVLLYYVVSGFGARIAGALQETAGIHEIEPLLRAVDGIGQHQRLAAPATRDGVADSGARLSESAARLDRALSEALPAWRKADLAGADGALALWRRLRDRGGPAAVRDHDELTAAVRARIDRVGDDAGLVLDSDLDSYYLLQLAVYRLPEAQHNLAHASLLARRASQETPSQRDLLEIGSIGNLLSTTLLPRIRRYAESALRTGASSFGVNRSPQDRVRSALRDFAASCETAAAALQAFSENRDSAERPEDLARLAEEAEQSAGAFRKIALEEASAAIEIRLSSLERLRIEALLASLAVVALAAFVIAVIGKNISRPLRQVAAIAREIAAGQLASAKARMEEPEIRYLLDVSRLHEHKAHDETCHVLLANSRMLETLGSMLGGMIRTAAKLGGSTAQILSAVHHIEETLNAQAASTAEVSATTAEIHANVQELVRTMSSVSQVVADASAAAGGGTTALRQMEAVMDGLRSETESVSSTLATISDRAGEVNEVIGTITQVANRTNLLSLNAAIEAERAEQNAGGFSVVALEIRRLADRTAAAALDIERLIVAMNASVRQGVRSVEGYVREIKTGSEAVPQLSRALDGIIDKTRAVGPGFHTVVEGMTMQAEGAGQIADTMAHLRDSAAEAQEAVAQFHTVAVQLRGAVEELQREVGRFSIVE